LPWVSMRHGVRRTTATKKMIAHCASKSAPGRPARRREPNPTAPQCTHRDEWNRNTPAVHLNGRPAKALGLCAILLRQHNNQNLLMSWAAPEFSLRRRGHSPLLMAFGERGKKQQWSWALPVLPPVPSSAGPGAALSNKIARSKLVRSLNRD